MGPPQHTILLDPEKVQWLVHSPEYYTHFANSHSIRIHIIYHMLPQMSNQSPNLSEVTNQDEPPRSCQSRHVNCNVTQRHCSTALPLVEWPLKSGVVHSKTPVSLARWRDLHLQHNWSWSLSQPTGNSIWKNLEPVCSPQLLTLQWVQLQMRFLSSDPSSLSTLEAIIKKLRAYA